MPPVAQTVTGSGIIDQAQALAALLSGNNLTARGQDINMRGQDIGLITSLAQFEQMGQAALQEYYNNVATAGMDKARSIYEQRLQSAQMGLQAASQGVSQRTNSASLKLQAEQMLADRRGPQNWVGYDYLLGKLGTPTGQAVDPTTFADRIEDPRFNDPNYNWAGNSADESLFNGVQGPQQANFNSARDIFAQASGGIGKVNPWQYSLAGQPQAGGAGQQQQAPGAYDNTWTPNSPIFGQTPQTGTKDQTSNEDMYFGVPDSRVSGLTKGQRDLVPTGAAGPVKASAYTNFKVIEPGSNRQYGPNEDVPGGTQVWLERLASGGPMHDKMAIVGEGASADDLGKNGEIIINWTGAPIDVLKNQDARAFIERMDSQMEGEGQEDDQGGEEPAGKEDDADEEPKSGEVTLGREMKKYGKGTRKSSFLNKLASYADGTLDPYQLAIQNRQALDQAGGAVTPEMRAFAQQNGLGSNLMYTADGQLHYQTPDMAWNAVSYGMPGVANGVETVRAVGNDPAYAGYRQAKQGWAGMTAADANALRAGGGGGGSAGQGGMSYTPPPGQGIFGQSAGTAAQGGSGSQTTVLDENGDYGMPTNDLHIKYDPATIGNQPFIKNLVNGQRQSGTYAGFGASLSNSRLGVKDIPTNINLQGWRDSDSSQQKATQSLYEQGFATDFGDIFKRAQRAAPAGVSTGRKRYGL